LESGWQGWGASVSGKAHKSDFDGNRLKRIYLKKCSIQPENESVNGNTSVSLFKSKLVMLRDVPKSLLLDVGMDIEENISPIANLQLKYDKLIDFVQNDPIANERFFNKIFSDISNRVYTGVIPLRSHDIRECLGYEYGIDGDVLNDMTDTFFLKLSGGN